MHSHSTVHDIRTTAFRLFAIAAVLVLMACGAHEPKPGTVRDEAMLASRPASSFPAADEDYFHDMDGGLPLTKEQIQGRNMWLVWTGGDDRLWDVLSVDSLGSLDFLKTVSSHPTLPYSRDTRWNYSRPGQRALLQEGHRSRPEPLRTLARRARSLMPT